MYKQPFYFFIAVLLLVLSACDNSSSNGGSSLPPVVSTTPELDKVFSGNATSDAVSIDVSALSIELEQIFGAENTEPVLVNAGDSINDIRNRASN